MTTFLLVRHAAHDNVGGWLAGRSEGVTLGPDGWAQANRLADKFKGERIDALWTSPRERTRQTADAICKGRSIVPQPHEALDEINFGEWSGLDFPTLQKDARWRLWNTERLCALTPAGDSMAAAQARMVGFMLALAEKTPHAVVALVSHADVIKAALFHALGMALDLWRRIDIAPASVSRLVIGAEGPQLLSLNEATP